MLLCLCGPVAGAGGQDTGFSVSLSDNNRIPHGGNRYAVTPDSVIIWGYSDYGRSIVRYTERAMTVGERRRARAFLKKFPFRELEDAYVGEPSMPFEAGHAVARTIEVSGQVGGEAFYSRMTGCYAAPVVRLCTFMNRFFPPEVAIRIREEDFTVRFP